MVYEDDDVLLVDFGHGGQFKRSPFNYAGDITKQNFVRKHTWRVHLYLRTNLRSFKVKKNSKKET